MINFEQLLAVFPHCLKTQPESFSSEALQELDTLLSQIGDRTDEEATKALKAWLKKYKTERDLLYQLAQENRELGKVPRNPESSEAGIRQNLYELRETRNGQKPSPESSPKP